MSKTQKRPKLLDSAGLAKRYLWKTVAIHGAVSPFRVCHVASGEVKAKLVHWDVDEGRKRVILIAAAILAARKLSPFNGGKRVPATVAAISDAVRWAEAIMKEIDNKWPSPDPRNSAIRKMSE